MRVLAGHAIAEDLRLIFFGGEEEGLWGSVNSVFQRLLCGGPKRPDRVTQWFNAWCPTGPVAIGCPLSDHWQGEVTETRHPHGAHIFRPTPP
ncbi:hypothetical protein [Nonomuraea basaltis]|uniref:hypothetical protein n=1 Tax=Nonomuraea basaltis TaxID=2495887 RepID=UPI00197D9921|nr:hypothetical protein [Nonomuraea basaltis]